MAGEIQAPAAPRGFAFGGMSYFERVVGFQGQNPRRYVLHEFPKRRAGIVEDQEQGSRKLTIRMVFLGDTASTDYTKFKDQVKAKPIDLLVHPIQGTFHAFCAGPDETVDFQQAVDLIEVNVLFIETVVDATQPADIPDVATAAQNVTGQLTQSQRSQATTMGKFAKLQTSVNNTLNAIDSAINNVAAQTDPVTFMATTIAAAQGLAGTVIKVLDTLQIQSTQLTNAVNTYVGDATDLFTGSDVVPGFSDNIDNLLGQVQAAADTLTNSFIAASPTNAGAADAVSDIVLLVEQCLTLQEAIQAEQPPLVIVVVPRMMNLLAFAVFVIEQFNSTQDPQVLASLILAQNRIPNPAAIPGGTPLEVPTQ